MLGETGGWGLRVEGRGLTSRFAQPAVLFV